VIISARPVPGNELRVHNSINELTRCGAEVLHELNADVHVSGHACSEELRQLLALVRPRQLMPVHGEYRMQAAHARLGQQAGIPADSILICENGTVVELDAGRARVVDHIRAGATFVDGLGVGDLSDVALRDRQHLAEDGILIIVATLSERQNGHEASEPELIFRGFGDHDWLEDELRAEAARIVESCLAEEITEVKLLQEHLHDGVGRLVYDRTQRRPMILPVLVEV
jgi:ribonuclease J